MPQKISEFISENKVSAKDCEYHTFRDLEDGGKIRVLVLKKDLLARVEYICPKCKHEGYAEAKWARPFSIKCGGCEKTINVPKLKGKKEKKK